MNRAPLRRGVSVTVALVLLAGWLMWQTPPLPAQGKKDPPKKTETGKKDAPKEAIDVPLANAGGLEQIKYVNEMLDKQWAENKLRPAERCSDHEFIRRASLDIIGRIAKVHEIDEFMKHPPRERRARLIERLLAGDEYLSNWANMWTVMLLTRSGSGKDAQAQLEDWFAGKLKEDKGYVPDWSKIVIDLLTATGRTNENGAVNYILHHVGEAVPAGERAELGQYDFVPVTSRTTRLFLGLRTQCVQCHDHPFNGEWGQHHFWGINAFFRQVEAPSRPTIMVKKKQKGVQTNLHTLTDNLSANPKGLVSYERRSAVLFYTDAKFLDGKGMPEKAANRRQQLAKFITKSPFFSKAYVNRTWAHFFGKSFTKDAVDDFGEHNPASNPELLDRLADDWANKYQHNPKDLIRWICNSRAYGLSSVANETNDKPEDEVHFSRMLLKAMSPEQLFESLMIATMAKVGQSKETRAELREDWLNKLIVSFGDDEGNETTFNGTVVQALMLMNGQDINKAIMDKENGTVAAVLKKRAFSPKAAQDAMKDLYLAALNRPPTGAEYTRILNPKMYNFRPGTPAPKDAQAFWTGFYQDLFWAILNSNEFILNH